MTKKYFRIIIIFAVIVISYFIGKRSEICICNDPNISEIHVINPKYAKRYEPDFQTFLSHILRDSLKKIQKPYTDSKIDKVIFLIENETKLKNYIKKIAVDSSAYKIIVTQNDMKLYTPYYLVSNDSCYYIKPLKIIQDLKPEDR